MREDRPAAVRELIEAPGRACRVVGTDHDDAPSKPIWAPTLAPPALDMRLVQTAIITW